jgi:hypothetical protein
VVWAYLNKLMSALAVGSRCLERVGGQRRFSEEKSHSRGIRRKAKACPVVPHAGIYGRSQPNDPRGKPVGFLAHRRAAQSCTAI